MVAFPAAPVTGRRPSILSEAAEASWVTRIAECMNSLLKGKLNVTLDITLAANAASTTIIDGRINAFSALLLEPLTAHAAAALYAAPYVLVSTQQDKQVVFNHANNANIDKTFRLTIIG